jgi:UDP-N-acetylmuramate-alanine ligase
MATLKAARTGWQKRIIAVFQPHRYTRTQALFHDFLTAFYDADILILMAGDAVKRYLPKIKSGLLPSSE